MRPPSAWLDSVSPVIVALPHSALPTAAGCVAFGSTLALSTFCQMNVIGISTGSIRPIPSVVGVLSVALASVASHKASILTYRILNEHIPAFGPRRNSEKQHNNNNNNNNNIIRSAAHRLYGGADSQTALEPGDDEFRFRNFVIPFHTLRICAIGLVAFKLLGGRFWGIAPSSYTHLGSFARFSIPATERYATTAERALLEKIGYRWGCHTCGSKMWFRNGIRFHGDHMPPRVVAEQMNQRLWRRLLGIKTQFRFFPQCVDCSNMQGQILSEATRRIKDLGVNNNLAFAGGGRLSYFHGVRMRLNHFAGGIVAAVTVVGATGDDLDDEGAKKLRGLQERLQNSLVQYFYPKEDV